MSEEKTEAGKFVRKSYVQNNKWGIDTLTEILVSEGFTVHPNTEEDYDIDVLAERNGKKFFFEVEVKTMYPFTSQKDFKFSTVSFLARKKKWATTEFWYVIICRETKAYLACNSKKIFKDEFFETCNISTNLRQGKDNFFRVPKKDCIWNTLKEVI